MKKFIVNLIVVFFLLLSLASAYAQSKGGRWQFENNGFDTATWDAVDNNGTLQGAAAYSDVAPLIEGSAYLWVDSANVNDYFLVPDDPDLDFTDENIGISAWIYSYFVGNVVHYILNKGDQFANPKTTNYSLRLSMTGNLEFLVKGISGQAQVATSSFIVPRDQWTFVAIFYEFAAGKVYMWNEPSATPSDTLDFNYSFIANDDPLAIGSRYSSDPASPSSKDFEGRIDDVRIGTTIDQILSTGSSVAIHHRAPVPSEFRLEQNYPNPFNPRTVLRFSVPLKSLVQLSVYNVLGEKIVDLLDREVDAGSHELLFDASGLPGGIYFYTLRTGHTSMTRKMLVVK